MRRMIILLAAVSLTACAIPRDVRLDPAGPHPDLGTGNVTREESASGVLVVYTSRVRVDQDGRLYQLPNDLDWGSSHSVHTGYAIYDLHGQLLRKVPNHSPLVISDEGPSEVALPPGRYLLLLDRTESEGRSFWVTIETRRRTEVDPARFVLERRSLAGLPWSDPRSSPAAASSLLVALGDSRAERIPSTPGWTPTGGGSFAGFLASAR